MQMDETAFPILLVDMLRREAKYAIGDLQRWWKLVERAAKFIVRNGPVTQQDRWEEDAGYSPFTLAVEIAGLLAAADLGDAVGEKEAATHLRETGDCWNDNIERWCYAKNSDLARQIGVEGYYVRIAPPETDCAASPLDGYVPIKNRAPGQSSEAATHVISPDALALVRFGLRAPDDPRILNTIKVIDALLRVKLPQGPCWYRYNDDGYGEHEDGSPFDGTGIGRGWPLLAGERAHYELARGNRAEAEKLLHIIEAQTSPGGFIPEQVWDDVDMPDRELFNGHPSGSAMPLMWAHAEYIKLLRSLRDGKIFDLPPQTVQRYLVDKVTAKSIPWRFNLKAKTVPAGYNVCVEVLSPATVVWTTDNWATQHEQSTTDSSLGIHVLSIASESLPVDK